MAGRRRAGPQHIRARGQVSSVRPNASPSGRTTNTAGRKRPPCNLTPTDPQRGRKHQQKLRTLTAAAALGSRNFSQASTVQQRVDLFVTSQQALMPLAHLATALLTSRWRRTLRLLLSPGELLFFVGSCNEDEYSISERSIKMIFINHK